MLKNYPLSIDLCLLIGSISVSMSGFLTLVLSMLLFFHWYDYLSYCSLMLSWRQVVYVIVFSFKTALTIWGNLFFPTKMKSLFVDIHRIIYWGLKNVPNPGLSFSHIDFVHFLFDLYLSMTICSKLNHNISFCTNINYIIFLISNICYSLHVYKKATSFM